MEFSSVLRRVSKFATDNSPAIFTAVAVVGTGVTAYLTGRAVMRAESIVANYEQEAQELTGDENYTVNGRTYVEQTWHEFIPPAIAGLGTVAAIIAANRIGTRRTVAMAAALAISEKAYDEYKDKVVEKFGANKERKVREETIQERVAEDPRIPDYAYLEGGLSSLCYDLFTGRPFISDMETLRRVENDINHRIINDMYVSLSEYYELIGLEKTSMSDDFGWNLDKLLELNFTPVLTPAGRPCIAVDFKVAPIRGFHRLQ